ncbi:hypothetical protein DAVIS_01255 [Mycobacterium marinum]|uniref:Uncharacterized protein n=1 Tax=Mycobacterium marinum TaxID=1781 RepID=A0A3E2N078_MYCMR|nr:hypothetical protein [Mycobacterium marinum]RFZ45425.1 hypothetical protein DAVIS_01255 [Mycobacterium marinum]GJO50640.1 hypothetical protein NJB1604_37220 [Mycobacterium marinum]
MTSTIAHPATGVTGEVDEALVASIRARLTGAGPEGAPLNDLLHELAAEGHDLHLVTSTIMRLIRHDVIDLTADRTLRWADGQAEGVA